MCYKASLIDPVYKYFNLSSATDEGSSQSVPSPASSSISCPDPDQIVSGSYQTNKSEEGKPQMSSAASPAPFDSEEAAIKVIFAALSTWGNTSAGRNFWLGQNLCLQAEISVCVLTIPIDLFLLQILGTGDN